MRRILALAVGLAALVATAASAQPKPVTLRAISAFPANIEFSKQFRVFIDRVNSAGTGVVAIQFVGGPEVIPPQQQDTALRNGVFDMQMGPASYYNGIVPEADALFGASIGPVEARQNGATQLLNKIWRQKLRAEFIAWQSGHIPFYVYLSDEPKMNKDGILDLSGLQMRSTPAYREWFDALGGNNVMLQTSEIFTAMERGIVRGIGWPAFSFVDLGVQKFIKYRVAPPVWQLDLVVIMNATKWDALSPEAKKIIMTAAAEHEAATQRDFAAIASKELATLEAGGLKTVEVANPSAHKKLAHDLVWARLAGRDPANVEALKAKLYAQ